MCVWSRVVVAGADTGEHMHRVLAVSALEKWVYVSHQSVSLAGRMTTTLFLERIHVAEMVSWDAFVSSQLASNAGKREGEGGESSCRGSEGEGRLHGSFARGGGSGGDVDSDRAISSKSVSVLQGRVLILTGALSPVSYARECVCASVFMVCVRQPEHGCLQPLPYCAERVSLMHSACAGAGTLVGITRWRRSRCTYNAREILHNREPNSLGGGGSGNECRPFGRGRGCCWRGFGW